jgi:TP901 family phage tail tape measure protein
MNKAIAKLFVELGLDPKGFDKGVDAAIAKTKKMAGNLRKVGAGMSAAFTAPAIAGVIGLAKLGEAHDSLLDQLRTSTGKTGDALKDLDNRALEVYANIPTSLDKVGDAFSMLSQKTNLTGADLQNVAQSELELARITGTDLAGNIDATAKLFNNWNVAGKDQSATLDTLFRASQATGVGVAQLSADVAQAGPILRDMGFGLDDSIALFAQLEKAGLDSGTVVTGLRTAFKKFSDEGLTDTNAALTDVFGKIKGAGSDIAAGQIAIDTFGSKAGPSLAESIRTGKLSYEDLVKTIADGTDTIVGVAASTNDWRENLQILRNRIAVQMIPVADYLFAKINSGIPYLETAVDKFTELYEWLGKLSPVAKKAAAVFAAILVGIGPALLAISAVLSVWGTIAAAAGAIFSPVLVVIAAVALAGYLLYKAWKTNFLGIRDLTARLLKWVTPIFHNIVRVVRLLGDYWHDVATNKIQPGNLKKLPGWLRPIALVIARLIKTVRIFVKAWQDKGLIAALRTIPTQLRALGRAAAKLLDQMGLHHLAAAVNQTFHDLARFVTDAIKVVEDIVHGDWKKAWHDLGAVATDLFWLFIDRFKMAGALILDIFAAIPWGTIGDALWSGLKSAADFLKTTGAPYVATKGAELIGALWSAMSDYWDTTVKPWAQALPGKLKDFIGAHWQEVYNAGRDLLGWLWTGIASLLGWLAGQAPAIGSTVLSAIQSFAGWFYNAGRDIVSALWTGISSLGGWLFNMVWDFAKDNTIGALNKAIGRNSPPKAFIDAGQDISKATGMGINKSAHIARKAAANMLAGAGGRSLLTPAGSAPLSAAAAGGGSIATAPRPIVLGERAIVVEANGSSREEANRIARYIVREVHRKRAAG